MNPYISAALITGSIYLFGALLLWLLNRKPRAAATAKDEGETVESVVNGLSQLLKARLDEIELLKANNAELVQQMAATKVEFERRIKTLEDNVEVLEARNASLRRRLDAYEMNKA